MSAAQFQEADHGKDVANFALFGAAEHNAVCLELLAPQTRNAIQSAFGEAGIALVVRGPEGAPLGGSARPARRAPRPS
jgi:hypothetical protein